MAALQGQIPERVLNVGTGRETTTLQLAEHIRSTLQSNSEILYGDRRAGDVERSLLDADRLVELLGPTVTVSEGLKITAEWFRKRASQP